ncbi:ABC transporter permease [Cellulomonas composti]|uniref:ABC transporter permease n=1 Tax=Cellulomonas composti TaxID=266130 RepID=A0A511JBV0_9CELL|nr:ABC transporter permease [Cellulomonas composti]GEL95467.1 hypothetical protein CCO02nite_21250 [Cellulomonas composti]
MRAALLVETRKITSTRMWWLLLVVMAGYMALLAAGLAWALTQADAALGATDGPAEPLTPDAVVRSVYTIAVSLGYVFPLLIGGLSYPSEVRHQTITPTYLFEPRRSVVLAAKLTTGGAVGVLFGLVGTLTCVLAGGGVLAALGEPTMLGEPGTWRTIALSALALTVWALVGVALGSVLTNQVAVVVVVLAFTQLVEPVIRLVLGLTSWGADLAAYLPGAAGEAISGGSLYSASGVGGDLLEWWQGLLVLIGYVAVLATVGRLTTLRRDVT